MTAGDYVLAKSVAGLFGVHEAGAESRMAAPAGSPVGRTAAAALSFIPFVNSAVAAEQRKQLARR
jgi:hypothetical protein